MANPKIRFKRSAIPGKIPTVSDLPLGEIAINTNDGEIYMARNRPGIGTDIVRVGAGATVINVLYVTQDGNDNNTGKKLGDAKRTIKAAVAESVPGTVIKVSAGIYLEDNPIVLPNNVSIVGDSLREVTVTPKNKTDLFWLDNGCYIAEMSFIGPPAPGAAIVTFNPEVVPYIDQSPYIQNCTNFIAGSTGLDINGKNAIGPIKSMVLDSYTQINPGGIGAYMYNGAYAQLVSLFTICSGTGVRCDTGGGCDLTNSNSSFGDFGLVADGVSDLKYVGIVTSFTNPDSSVVEIKVDASAPVMNVVDAEYDHVTGISKFVLDREHNLSVGMGVTIAGLGFTCDSDGGIQELIYPTGNYGYIFETRTVAPGRYVDAKESIQSNRTEILDKSLASIALNHPDFFFPGEDQTNSRSRFYDSYRLIQQNKQEIIDKSLAQIAVDHPDFYFPNDQPTNEKSRFFDSYRLIQQNKQEIIDKSLAQISIEHPDFYFPDTSRNRFKDSYDLINANEAELIDKSLATISLYHPDFYFPDDQQTNERSRFYDSYRLIIDNKQEIVDKSLAAISLNYDQYPTFFFPDDDETNERSRFYDAYRLINQNKQEVIDKSLASIALNYDQFYFPGDDETNERSRFYDSYRLIQQNKQEIIDKSLAAISIDHPDFYFPGDEQTTSRSRFYDSYRLIQQNKQEIIDKSLASISISYPDFYFPDDQQTNERSRFYDSYRLIQQNKQEIIDKSIGGIALNYDEYSTDWVFPGDQTTNDRSRYYDSYRLIQKNRQDIIDTAWTETRTQYPFITSTETKCKRDLGFFIDAISTDILTGGNSYSQDFVLQYFVNGSPLPNGLVGEEVQSVFAFNRARDLMRSAITNQLTYKDLTITADPTTGSNTSTSSCADVRSNIDNLTSIVTTSISNGNTNNLGVRNLGLFAQTGVGSTITPGGVKCARDIGFLVDAIATDVFTGGNNYSREFILQYFDESGNPISDGLYEEELQSLYGFISASDYMKRAITNQLNIKDVGISSGTQYYGQGGAFEPVLPSGNANSCLDVQDNIDTLVGIVTAVVGLGTEATAGDVTATVNFGYFNQTVGVGTTSSPGGFKCARDLGFFVDAISTDLFVAGNYYSDGFALQYFDNAAPIINGLLGEEGPSVVAFESAGDYAKRAITNQLNRKDVGISSGKAIYNGSGQDIPVLKSGNPLACIDVQDSIDSLVGIVTVAVGLGTVAFLPSTTNTLDLGEFNLTLGISTISPGGYTCARDLEFLVDAVSTDVFTGGNNYSREFILQYFDENGDPIVDGLYGEEGPSLSAFVASGDLMKKALTNQLYVKDVGISSGTQYYGQGGDLEPVLLSGNKNSCLDVQDNVDTLVGIVTAVVGLGTEATTGDVTATVNFGYFAQSGIGTTSSPGGFKCARDLGFLVDAVSTDLFVAGNVYSTDFALQYFDNSGNPISDGLIGEEAQSIVAFESASDYMKRAITNQLNRKDVGISSGKASYAGAGTSIPVLKSGNRFACADVQANIENLVGIVTVSIGLGTVTTLPSGNALNRGLFTLNIDPFTKQTLNRISYGTTSPGGQKCSRDLGYLVDSVATDVFTGGNAYSVGFLSFYFDEDGNPRSDALLGEEAPSVVSFGAVADYAKKAITNQLNIKDVGISSGTQYYGQGGDLEPVLPSGNANSCLDVQDNIDTLVAITTEAVGLGTTTGIPAVNTGYFNQAGIGTISSPGGFKCARDLGFLRFAIAEDVYTGGNRRIVGFALSYFDAVTGDPLTNGLLGEESESITAFTAFGDLARAAVTNQLNAQDLTISPDYLTGDNRDPESCADVQAFIENLVGIATVTIGAGNTSQLPVVNKGFDERDDEQYRFFDSYRLIQQNKQEIVDRSIGEIAAGYDAYDTFFFPGDSEENNRSRFYDAYRLIQLNKEVIVGTAFTNAVNNTTFTGFDFAAVQDKCKRDTAFFIDAISLDVLTAGNRYASEFTLQYFDANGNPINNGLVDEIDESVYVFTEAASLMKDAITNSLVGAAYSDLTISTGGTYYGVGSDVPNNDSTACLDVQDNVDTLVGIVTVALGAGDTTSLPTINEGYFSLSGVGTDSTPGGVKCARDVGFFVDAVSTDVFIAGNKYSQEFTLQYFNNGSAIYIDGNEVQPTVVGLIGAGEFMKDALTNQLYRKDVGISSGPAYYGADTPIIPVLQSGNEASCLDVQDNVDTLVGIVTVALGAGSTTSLASYTYNTGIFDSSSGIGATENPGGFKCARDLRFLVDSVSTDVFTGGNIYSRGFSEQYYNADGTPIRGGLSGEEAPSLTAFEYSSDMMKKAITNQLYAKDLTLTFGPASYGGVGIVSYTASGNSQTCIDVQGTIESLVGIITSVIGAGNTAFLYDGTIGISSGAFYQIPGEFNQTIGFGTALSDLVAIGATVSPGGYKCARDIGYLVDAVSTDVFVGGNTYSIGFAKQYFAEDGSPIAPGLDVEREESVTAFNQSGELMKKALTNQLYAKDLTLTFGPAFYGQNTPVVLYNRSGNSQTCQDVQDFVDNRVGIITSVIGIGSLSALDSVIPNSGTFLDNESKCRRDIGYFVDAVSKDLENFTNKNTIEATNYYFDAFGNPISDALIGEEVETVTAFEASGSYMKLAINNQLNSKNFSLLDDVAIGSNNDPDGCSNVKDTIDNLIGIATEAIIAGTATTVAVSAASTFFTANVGAGPFPHYYTSGGTVQINAQRPFDGQVVVFDKLYYQVNKIIVTNGGSGYTDTPEVTIGDPTTIWGVPAQAIATVENGRVVAVEVVSSGRGFIVPPVVSITPPPSGGTPARITVEMAPVYFTVSKATEPSPLGVSTVTFDTQVPYELPVGMPAYFYKQSRILAAGISFEFIGAGIDVKGALPQNGGVTKPENQTVSSNGGLVVYTSTDQSGNFKIGDGLIINQNTGTISGTSYSKSLFSTLTPFILALGGE